MVNCTWYAALCFCFLSIVYGSAFAMTDQALKYFIPGFIQAMRMFFGFGFSSIVFIFRLIFSKEYRTIAKLHFTSGIMPIVHLCIGGLLNLGIPHCLIAVGQQWVPTCSVNAMMPLSTSAGAIFGHFVLDDEKFDLQKGIALILSLIGAVLACIPQFMTASLSGNAGQIGLGFFLIVISMVMFGVAPVYFKWKTHNIDVTVSSMIQTLASGLFGIIYSLCSDGPDRISHDANNAPAIGWMWPLLAGVISTGLAVHLFMFLLQWLGAFGANFIPFGQLITGMIISVSILKEWSNYKWWEILVSILGIIVLCCSMAIGFYQKKDPNHQKDETETDESQHEASEQESDKENNEDVPLNEI